MNYVISSVAAVFPAFTNDWGPIPIFHLSGGERPGKDSALWADESYCANIIIPPIPFMPYYIWAWYSFFFSGWIFNNVWCHQTMLAGAGQSCLPVAALTQIYSCLMDCAFSPFFWLGGAFVQLYVQSYDESETTTSKMYSLRLFVSGLQIAIHETY